MTNINLKTKKSLQENYLKNLNILVKDDFKVKSDSMLIHNTCGNKISYNRMYLSELISKNKQPSCPHCKRKIIALMSK